MRIKKQELKLKKDLSKIEIGDILLVDDRDFLLIVRTASRKSLDFSYCGVLVSSSTLQFWFTSSTIEDLRDKIVNYPIKLERFSKDEYDLNLMCKIGVGELSWVGS